jgi:hypothetical protein
MADDGVRHTFLSSLIRKVGNKLSTIPAPRPTTPEEEEEPEPEPLARNELVELRTLLPAKLDVPGNAWEHLVASTSLCREPLAFELLGVPGQVSAHFVAGEPDAAHLRCQLQAHVPDALFQECNEVLPTAWEGCEGPEALIIEFGLAREFMHCLAQLKLDPFVGIVSALSELQSGELGLFQVLFQAVRHPWNESITRSVTDATGSPFFVNAKDLVSAAVSKASTALYAAVVRVAVKALSFDRSLQIACDLAGSLRVFSNPTGNELIPLTNELYRLEDHIEDVLRRQSRRSGMILTSHELVGFVHLPSTEVRSQALKRESGKTKAAPAIVQTSNGVVIGSNEHAGGMVEVKLTPEQRVMHTHIVGASGTGKSTLLYNLIRQDIENGEGIAVLDPHGDLVDRILGIIPAERVKDVVLVDPSDEEYSIGFNMLSAHSDLEKNLLASDLVSVFQRLSTSWGDQMGSVLNNAILAFLESHRKGTLADLRRFLVEPAFRTDFLKSVADPAILYYWQKGFPQLSGNRSIGSVITRLEAFLAPKPIRYMVSQPENRLDFAHMMDSGKIFLAKLSHGLLGKENSYLLGTLLVSKFQQLAMARQSQRQALRKEFWVYIDEFQNFISPSMAEILAGARKYRIGLILAHQELRQLHRDSEVASAVMSNPYTRICFRVGDDDARKLADGFAAFEARDLQNLGTGQAIARVERSTFDFNLAIPLREEPNEAAAHARRGEVIVASRRTYATPRADIERALWQAWEVETRTTPPVTKPERKTKNPIPADVPKPRVEPAVQSVPEPLSLSSSSPETVTPAPPAAQIKPVQVPEHKPSIPPKDLGRGGAQHKAVQHRIKAAAEKLGFRGVIEKRILEGQGSVDLLLERGEQSLACEISITTTIDHEVGNVSKCLKAGFTIVAVICLDEERLSKIAAAVTGSLGSEAAARVIFAHPDAFIARLKEMAPPLPTIGQPPKISKGYKVKHSVANLSPEAQKKREEAAIQSITETMRKRKKSE